MPVDRYGDALPGGAIARMGTVRFRNLAAATALVFTADGKRLASAANDASLRIWDVATGAEARQFGIYEGVVNALAWSPDGRLIVTGGFDGKVSVWDAATGNDLRQMPGHPGGALALTFTGDGETLLSAGADNIIRLWDPNSGEALGEIAENLGSFEVVAFAPDHTTIALGSWESTIRLCDIASGKEVGGFRGPRVGVKSLAFSSDGRALATGSVDGSISIWERSSGKERWQFPKHPDGTFCVAFSRDSRLLATSGADTTILVWDVTGRLQERSPSAGTLVPAQVPPLWDELANDDAMKAYRAVRTLARAADVAVPFLKDKLQRLTSLDPREIATWIVDLSNGQLAIRERATLELEKRGALIEPALRAAQEARPSLEARRRLERLLLKLGEPVPPTMLLQGLRGVEALELTDAPEARRALEAIGQSASKTLLTREAGAAALRMTGK
jgi:hypothetical protein